MDIIAWIGSVAFAVCAVPQAWRCYRTKSGDGLDWLFLALWSVGEVCLLAYSIHLGDGPLIVNYVSNGVALCVIISCKVRY